MVQRIHDYIREKAGGGNLVAYNILIHIAHEMLIDSKNEDEIKNRIDHLVSEPV